MASLILEGGVGEVSEVTESDERGGGSAKVTESDGFFFYRPQFLKHYFLVLVGRAYLTFF